MVWRISALEILLKYIYDRKSYQITILGFRTFMEMRSLAILIGPCIQLGVNTVVWKVGEGGNSTGNCNQL